LVIESFKTISDSVDIDINAPVGTTYTLGSSTVTMIDPYTEYVSILKECFDFDALRAFLVSQPKFSMLFDGMHGAGGPFAKRVLVDELGLPEVCCVTSGSCTNTNVSNNFSMLLLYLEFIAAMRSSS
jgi:phosphoglucomutase